MGCCTGDHCATDPTPPKVDDPAHRCPSCGQPGRRVKPVTIESLARRPRHMADGPADDTWRFCGTPGCTVVWFSERGRQRLTLDDCRVRVGQKEQAEDRPLCYCFGFSARDVRAEVEQTGDSTIPARITERCRRGEDRCEQTNPQGSCCLGNVRAAVKAEQARLGARHRAGLEEGTAG